MRIEDIQFYELRFIRTKKFAKRLKKLFSDKKLKVKEFEEKVSRIKSMAEKINNKL